MTTDQTRVAGATETQRPSRPALVVIAAPTVTSIGTAIELGPEGLVMGRAERCSLRLDDDGVSREHARIQQEPSCEFVVEDLGSTNGTFVNGRRITRTALKEGDHVRLGPLVVLRFSGDRTLTAPEERVREALAASEVALWDYDLQRQAFFVSAQADAVMRVAPGTLSGRALTVLEVLGPEDRAALHDALQHGERLNLELRWRLASGSIWVALKGLVTRAPDGSAEKVSGTITNVSVRRAREDELRRQAEAFESLDDGIVVLGEDGAIAQCNVTAERLFQRSRGELVGASLGQLHPELDSDQVLAAVKERGRFERSFELDRGNESVRSLELTATPLRDRTGVAMGLVVALRDVTEQRKLRARVELAERLASLGTLVAGIAHEINNPLSFVLANLHFLEETRPGSGEDVSTVIAETIDGANRIARIVRNLKQFSRPDSKEAPSPVDLRRPIERACAMAGTEVRYRAELVTRIAEDVPAVMADEGQLCQVVLNLLSNAVQAIPEGKRDQRITVELDRRDAWVVLAVSDTGKGMSPEVQAQLFTPFFTTRGQAGGTGLGLSICFGIVQALGGRIQVDSKEGVGTRFEVWLPATGPSPRPSSRETPITAVPTPVSRVLVIDDDPNVLTALRRVLRHEHDVVPVTTGDDALALLREGHRFDTVLCDLMMPGMSGMELFEQASKYVPEIALRFVFMTGGAFSPRAKGFVETCTLPTVTKPFDFVRLRTVLRQRSPAAAA